MGYGEYKINPDGNLHEAFSLKLDISKAAFYLKWMPVHRVDEALEKTINWYQEYYKGNEEKVYQYTLSQIMEYVNNAMEHGSAWSKKQVHI